MIPYVFTLCAVAAIACGQILFKITADRMKGRALEEWVLDFQVILPFFFAMVIYASATVLWILALRDLPLSRAYMFMTLSFIIVPFISAFLFGEEISLGFIIGLVFILIGLFITQRFS